MKVPKVNQTMYHLCAFSNVYASLNHLSKYSRFLVTVYIRTHICNRSNEINTDLRQTQTSIFDIQHTMTAVSLFVF